MIKDLRETHNSKGDRSEGHDTGFVVVPIQLGRQEAVHQMKAVANAVLQFLGKRFLLIDELLHANNRASQIFFSGGRYNRFSQNVGKAGEEVDVVFLKGVSYQAIDLKNTKGAMLGGA